MNQESFGVMNPVRLRNDFDAKYSTTACSQLATSFSRLLKQDVGIIFYTHTQMVGLI